MDRRGIKPRYISNRERLRKVSKLKSTVLSNGKKFHELDFSNPEDLELIALHPLGITYLEGIEISMDIRLKKVTFLSHEELAEFLAHCSLITKLALKTMVKQASEKLIDKNVITKDLKHIVEEVLDEEAQSIFSGIPDEFSKVFI